MEIYQLRTFVTVAKLGNLTRASEILHITQPAVTGQIKALEEDLGITLFDRRPGKICLTKAGELLIAEAQHVLNAAGALVGKAKEYKGSIAGTVVFGTLEDPDQLRLGSMLNAMVQAFPLLEIKTRAGYAEELREMVATESLQAAFYIGSHLPPELFGLPLQTVNYRIVGPVSYRVRLLHAGWREIADMPWISAPTNHHVRTLLKDMFSRQGLLPHSVVETDEVSAMFSMVLAGIGLALLREDIAIAAAERNEVFIWPHIRIAALLSFVYAKTLEHDPTIVGTISLLHQIWGMKELNRANLTYD